MKPTFLPLLLGHWGCAAIVVFPRATIRGAYWYCRGLIGVRDNAAVDVKEALVQSAQAELSVRGEHGINSGHHRRAGSRRR